LGQLSSLRTLWFYDNPLRVPPPEITDQVSNWSEHSGHPRLPTYPPASGGSHNSGRGDNTVWYTGNRGEKNLYFPSRRYPRKVTTLVRDQIFISYSHKDRQWLDKLLTMLKPLQRQGFIKIWSDTLIRPGTKWREEINQALMSAKIAVLLVTPDFLASDFIAKDELPPLLEAAEKEGLTVLWVAVSYSMYKVTEIGSYQALNNPAEPLDSLPPFRINQELVSIAEKIKEITSES